MSLQWHWWKQLAACTKMSLSSETGMWLNWISGSVLEPEPSTVMIYPTTIIIWTWCSGVETMQCVFHCVHPCVCVCVDAELYAPKWADVSTIFSWWTVSAVIASVLFPRDNIWIIPFRHQTVTDVFNNELGRCVYDWLWVKFQSVFQNL